MDSTIANNKPVLFCDYYKQWITVYKEGAIRSVTMNKYNMAYEWLKKLVPTLAIGDLDRITYQNLLNEYANHHERQTTMDFHHHLKCAILDAKTLSEVAVVDGEYLGADESGVYSYVRTDNQGGLMNNLYLTFFKTDYNGSTKVAGEVTPEFFSGDADYQLEYEEYSILEVPCFQILKDCIVFNVGYYQGTGHFYTGGIIGYIMKNETSPYYCTKTSWENFYATETDEGIAVFHNGIEGMEKTAIAGVGADAVDYESEKKAVPYVYSESKIASYGKRYDVGDVVIYADDSGELTTLLKASEYEEFGYTTKNNDYENGPVTEIYNIEYTGDKLFFSIAKMEHMPENDIGWRIAYRHSQTADFVKNMTTGKIDMLGEYGPDVE